METETGEPNKINKKDRTNTKVDDAVLEDQDNLIDDVEVDMVFQKYGFTLPIGSEHGKRCIASKLLVLMDQSIGLNTKLQSH